MKQTGRIRQIPYYFAQIARKVIHNYSPHLSRQNFVLLFRSRWHNSVILRTKCSTLLFKREVPFFCHLPRGKRKLH